MVDPQTLQKVAAAVNNDPHLTKEEKARVLDKLNEPDFISYVGSAAGAGSGYLIGKFFNLSKVSQAVLAMLGYGIGRYLLDKADKHDKFVEYNRAIKAYEIKS